MEALRDACRTLIGAAPVTATRLHGGDLSQVMRLGFADGTELVAKLGPMVDREARMLQAISGAEVPAPRVVGQTGEVVLLEALDEVRAGPDHWARFGEDLARLHRTSGARYGWAEDYAFGPVTIYDAPIDDWPGFWAERRLLPFVSGLDKALGARVDRLAGRLGAVLPAAPAPGLLHGDLWTGNLLATQDAIRLIDPACYYGDGEVDLAMLHLFGGPGPGFQASYGALAPGWEERRAVYSLFPALVHLRLFGAGYAPMVERFLTAAGG